MGSRGALVTLPDTRSRQSTATPGRPPYHGAVPQAVTSVPHHALTRAEVPSLRAEFDDVIAFAYTYDGYARYGLEGCGELANATLTRFLADRALPDDLDELRACLFFEARRWIVLEREPDTRARLYVGALLAAIEERLDDLHEGAEALPLA